MPNYVYTTLFVSGTPDEVLAFGQQVGQSYQRLAGTMDNPEFSFWNIIKPASEEWYNSNENWYNWNIEHWNTKWDCFDVCREYLVHDITSASMNYSFTTAWTEPAPIFDALIDRYPNLNFTIHYQEEQGWGGEIVAVKGQVVSTKEWDIPNSHADYEAIGDECSVCWDNLDTEYWFDDCPNKQEYATISDILGKMSPEEASKIDYQKLLSLGATTLAQILADYEGLTPEFRESLLVEYV
jgi:hypothetical protein